MKWLLLEPVCISIGKGDILMSDMNNQQKANEGNMDETCNPTTIVIFGASGDLTWRKLIPGLYNNFKKGRLENCVHVVGYARRPFTDESWREFLKSGVVEHSPDTFQEETWTDFSRLLSYFQGNLDVPEDFQRLAAFLSELERGDANRLYYLATGPEHFSLIVKALGKAAMAKPVNNGYWRRIILEKPFGEDLKSAQQLNRVLHTVFDETQIFRIDHYLGKETAQNILFFRFANTIFEPVWNRRYINNVQISVTEAVDIEHRAGYYDKAGVIRDMFQNHLLSLLALVAMEPPSTFRAEAVRNEKIKILESIRPISLTDTVRGQYEGYTQAQGVAPDSQTATYGALKLYIDNWRWQGVPFYLRSGKALAKKASEITIEFQKPPHMLFYLPVDMPITPNILSLFIQPDEGIHLRFEAKKPDSDEDMRSVVMDFRYRTAFDQALPDAYERLLLEAMDGDASLFTRSDAIEQAWTLIDPIDKGWSSQDAPPLYKYPVGSRGPGAADELLARDGRIWRSGFSEEGNVSIGNSSFG
jgi:glucose-6-phosphate 1-dehydrogenase